VVALLLPVAGRRLPLLFRRLDARAAVVVLEAVKGEAKLGVAQPRGGDA
jgi:hypothetical protein